MHHLFNVWRIGSIVYSSIHRFLSSKDGTSETHLSEFSCRGCYKIGRNGGRSIMSRHISDEFWIQRA